MPEYLRVEVDGPIARVVLDRPEKGHAWLAEMWVSASNILEELAQRDNVRVILLDSTGDRIFSGGADLVELASLVTSGTVAFDILDRIESLMGAIERAPQAVVAVISGTAMGAGLEIAAAADLRIAADTARFGIPAAQIGIVVTRTDVARIARLVGAPMAWDLLLTGRILDADEALAAGIVSMVRTVGALREAAGELAQRIADLSPFSIREMKRHLLAVAPHSSWDPEAYGPSVRALTSEDFRARSERLLRERLERSEREERG